MSGHSLLQDLRDTVHAYGSGGNILINWGSGAPDGTVDGLIYIRTDGTAEDTRLYLRGDPAADDWEPVLGGV